jgi:subtilisin family serine protease
MSIRRTIWLFIAIAFVTPAAAVSPDRAGWLARLGADRWHAAGWRGQGVKVAVLDSGFRGWQSWRGSALPRNVSARSFRFDNQLEARDSSHGVLCAEVVHALAPEAEILLANWEPDRPESFVQAIQWARQNGARVLTCSVIMPAWSDGEGGGAVHAAIAAAVGPGTNAGDLLCCACAGNIAQRHWSGRFRASAGGWHEWQSGQIDNLVTPWNGDDRVSVELCWPAGPGFRAMLVDATTGRELARSSSDHAGSAHSAVVRFSPPKDSHPAIRVQPLGPGAGTFHVAVLGGWLATYSENGSIPFPGDGPEFLTIGAWEADGRRAGYSSCGPNSSRPKPDFVAQVPVPSSVRDRPFSGTSAAAPQAAGLAALYLSRYPQNTVQQVREALRTAARDVAAPGHDVETGFGVLRLDD